MTRELALQELIFPATLFAGFIIYTIILLFTPTRHGFPGMKNPPPPPPKKRPIPKSRKQHLYRDPKLRYPTPNMREKINKEYNQDKSE